MFVPNPAVLLSYLYKIYIRLLTSFTFSTLCNTQVLQCIAMVVSCEACHKRKKKCIPVEGTTTCKYCTTNEIECVPHKRKKKRKRKEGPSQHDKSASLKSPPELMLLPSTVPLSIRKEKLLDVLGEYVYTEKINRYKRDHNNGEPSKETKRKWGEDMLYDMSTTLEQVLVNGRTVQLRESSQIELFHSGREGKKDISATKNGDGGDEKKGRAANEGHSGDEKLYQSIFSSKCTKSSFFDDDYDDLIIPEEYLASKADEYQEDKEQYLQTLNHDDPAKRNEAIRKRYTYDDKSGTDGRWNSQYWDGIVPQRFVEKCCKRDRGKVEGFVGTSSSMDGNYTSSLLQRCWDRAVHAASSTVPVPSTLEEETKLDTKLNNTEEIDLSDMQSDEGVASILHNEAMDVVDTILDVLLANDSDNNLGQLFDNKEQHIDWKDVLGCLQAYSREQEKYVNTEDSKSYIWIKSLSMRLIERYEATHRKKPLIGKKTRFTLT